MSLRYARFKKNGSTQKADSRNATGAVTINQRTARRPGRTISIAKVNAMAKNAGKRWLSPDAARSAAARPRPRPVSMPRKANPM